MYILNNEIHLSKNHTRKTIFYQYTAILGSFVFDLHTDVDYCIRIFLRRVIIVPFLFSHQINLIRYVPDIKPMELILTAQNVYLAIIILLRAIYRTSHDALGGYFVVLNSRNLCRVISQLQPIIGRVIYCRNAVSLLGGRFTISPFATATCQKY